MYQRNNIVLSLILKDKMKSILERNLHLILILSFSLILTLFLCQTFFVEIANAQDAKKIVKIGCISPLTGNLADVGIGIKNCVELAIDMANSSGEFPYEIKLVAEDDASDPATGVAAALKVCSDPAVIGIVSHVNSPVGLATIHTTHRFGIVQIMPGTIHPDITRGNDYKNVFRICPDNIAEQSFAQELLVKELGYKKWASIFSNDSYGMGCNENLKMLLSKNGGTILSADGFNAGTKDFRPILNRLKTIEELEGIYFGGLAPETSLCKRQIVELGMDKMPFYGLTGMVTTTFNEIAGSAAENAIGVGYSTLDEDSDFVKNYKSTYNEPWEFAGSFSYEAANMILEALKNVGPNREAIVNYIANPDYEYYGVIGLTKFDEYGQTTTGGLEMKISKNGEWVNWSDEYRTIFD